MTTLFKWEIPLKHVKLPPKNRLKFLFYLCEFVMNNYCIISLVLMLQKAEIIPHQVKNNRGKLAQEPRHQT